jgi:hypothetical protein
MDGSLTGRLCIREDRGVQGAVGVSNLAPQPFGHPRRFPRTPWLPWLFEQTTLSLIENRQPGLGSHRRWPQHRVNDLSITVVLQTLHALIAKLFADGRHHILVEPNWLY